MYIIYIVQHKHIILYMPTPNNDFIKNKNKPKTRLK